jgi:hypothetical protein
MGSIFGGGSQTTQQQSTQSSQPWAAQEPYELQGFNQAQTNLNNANALGPYTGEFVPGQNPYQSSAINSASGYATGVGNQLPYQIASGVGRLYGASTPYVNNANSLATNGIAGPNANLMNTLNGYATGQTSGVNPALSAALNQAGISGANNLQNYSNDMQSIISQATSNPTQQLAQNAQTYMNSSPVQSAINSTNAQMQQVLNEQTNPSFNRAASQGGDLNSSRAGMGEAMNNEAESIAQGNADASILNNAYNTGLGTAANVYNTGLNTGMWGSSMGANAANSAAEGAANTQLNNAATQLGAANSGLSQGLNYELGSANTQLGANNQLGNAVGLGMTGAQTAGNLAAGDFGLESGAGALQQQGEQAPLTNALDQYEMQMQQPAQALDNYWGIVGQPLGMQGTSSGTSTTQNQLSPLSTMLGLGLGVGGMFSAGGPFGSLGAFGSGGMFGSPYMVGDDSSIL